MSKLVRKATAYGGKIRTLDMEVIEVFAFGPTGSTITAVQNHDGNLQLIKWAVSGDAASIQRIADAHAGPIGEVATAVVHYHVITAVTNGSGKLEIIAWNQDLAREGHETGDVASKIAICPFLYEANPDLFATGHRDSKGNLRLEVWSLSGSGSPALRGTASAGPVAEVALAFVSFEAGPGYRFVTATTDEQSELKLIQWSASSDGSTLKRLGSTSAGAASQVSIRALGDLLITTLRNGSGNLELITWRAQMNGSIVRLDTATAGTVSAVESALSFDAPGAQFLTTAVRNGDGNLELIDWKLQENGALQRSSQAGGGAVSSLRVGMAWSSQNPALVNPAPHTVLISAMRNATADLELISWTRE